MAMFSDVRLEPDQFLGDNEWQCLQGGAEGPPRMASLRAACVDLDDAERALAGALGTGEMAPFLGHYELPEHISRQLGVEIERGLGRIERRLRLLFYLWPALTVAWIARTVAERYGTRAQMEIYPHLAELLGVGNLDPMSRTRIAELFRHACRKLDLPLPEACEAVDAYVVQAGVPHAQIDRLADALGKAEQRVGLPDIDDDLSVAMFTEVAADAVDAGHPRLRKVLEHDTVGWYARLWTLLRERPEDLPDDAVARRLVECASAGANLRGASLKRPSLAWRDGLLSVGIPEGPGRRWVLTAEGWRQEVAAQSTPEAVPLPLPWPTLVEWQFGGLARRSGDAGTLVPPSAESVAVFASTGRLITTVRFGMLDEPVRPVRLPRGVYDFVGLTRFFGPEGLEASGVPGGWHLRIDLGTEPVTLVRGTRSATLAAVQRPELEFLGSAVRDLHGRTIHADYGLEARVMWPPGEQGLDESVPDEESNELGPKGFGRDTEVPHELLLEIPDKQLPPLPIEPLNTGSQGQPMLLARSRWMIRYFKVEIASLDVASHPH